MCLDFILPKEKLFDMDASMLESRDWAINWTTSSFSAKISDGSEMRGPWLAS